MGKSVRSGAVAVASSKPKSASSHKRASVACMSCKTRRTRCVKPEGKKACIYCQRHALDCIMTEDERKRSTSKAYLDSLRNRITLLEDMLRKTGIEPPPMETLPDGKSSALTATTRYPASSSSSLNPLEQAQSRRLERESSSSSFQFGEPRESITSSPKPLFSETASLDGQSTDWSIISASLGSDRVHSVPSVPSLSSSDDEGAAYTPENAFEKKEENIEGFVECGEWTTDFALDLGRRETTGWEGQAALLDMGFMLGLGAEEVLAVQRGMTNVEEEWPVRIGDYKLT